jgi:hypothetical protein
MMIWLLELLGSTVLHLITHALAKRGLNAAARHHGARLAARLLQWIE